MNIERRALHAEYRALPKERMFEAVVMAYNVVDDYGTLWQPGVFGDYLGRRMPRIAWGHDWTDPLGRYVDYRDNGETLTLIGEFDDFDAVPQARRAHAQLLSGTIDQFSVGFIRREWVGFEDMSDEQRATKATEVMVRADLPEASLVLVGAVPGTELVGVRSIRMANGLVPADLVIELGKKVDGGELTLDAARAALDLVAGEGGDSGADVTAELAAAEEALEDIGL